MEELIIEAVVVIIVEEEEAAVVVIAEQLEVAAAVECVAVEDKLNKYVIINVKKEAISITK
jgi:hypothetical protein